MVILFAGLPGTGKSYLAERLAETIDAVVLNRDAIRDASFPKRDLDYSEEQNEVASQVTYMVARYILERHRGRTVILDGRPFSKQAQIAEVQNFARSVQHELRVVYCWAPDGVVKQRLEQDAQRMQIADRTMEKYYRIRGSFEPLIVDHLVLDTTEPVEHLVQTVLEYIDLPLVD